MVMRPRRDPVKAGQESVWGFPRSAIAQPTGAHIRIMLGGRTIAESCRAIKTIETSHPPTFYLPPDDIDPLALRPGQGGSFCEWKSLAIYHDVVSGNLTRHRAAWSYSVPTVSFAKLRDHLAFYAGAMDACFVDREQVAPQAGGFYGGWITSAFAGPFKGAPGSMGW